MTGLAIPVVSALTAGLLIILQMILLLTVILGRVRNAQSLGDGGKPKMLRAIRRHGNFAENAAIFVICAALLEMLGGGRMYVEILCATFVLGRIFHVLGLTVSYGPNFFRFVGTVVTVIVGIAVGVRLIQIALPLLHLPMP